MTERQPARAARLASLLLLLPLVAGCVTHEHRVGLGPSGVGREGGRQFYLFFGLMQLNDVDVQRMASDLNSYSVETEFGWVDLLLSPLLLPLSVTSRTVTVSK